MARIRKHEPQVFLGRTFCLVPRGYYKEHYHKGGAYMHRVVWEHHNGPIPKGYDVHHKDGNKGNNDITNLEILTRSAHLTLHGLAHAKADPEKYRRHVREVMQPLAAKWHGSEAGREWHSTNAKKFWKRFKKETFACAWCKKEYETFRMSRKRGFCSMSCQNMARKASGVDDEQRTCEVCGKVFTANKYKKVRSCSKNCWKTLVSKGHKSLRLNRG